MQVVLRRVSGEPSLQARQPHFGSANPRPTPEASFPFHRVFSTEAHGLRLLHTRGPPRPGPGATLPLVPKMSMQYEGVNFMDNGFIKELVETVSPPLHPACVRISGQHFWGWDSLVFICGVCGRICCSFRGGNLIRCPLSCFSSPHPHSAGGRCLGADGRHQECPVRVRHIRART